MFVSYKNKLKDIQKYLRLMYMRGLQRCMKNACYEKSMNFNIFPQNKVIFNYIFHILQKDSFFYWK